MQRSPQEIKDKLLKALDQDYNVINMPVVVEIIGILEQTPITKECLESTRLGLFINELRRKTSDEKIAKRAKDLVRKWRDLIVPKSASGSNGVRPPPTIPSRTVSPGLPARLSQPASPSSRVSSLSPDNKVSPGISPAISPRLQGYSPLPVGRLSTPVVSPANSHQQQPSASPPQPAPRQRGRPPKNKNKQKRPRPTSPTTDLVPKTSPANKRLRKDSPPAQDHIRANGVRKVPHEATSEVPSETRKRDRRKRPDEEDLVKEAMANMVRTPKVKTTRELLQSIQQESSLDHLRNKTLGSLGVAKPVKLEKTGTEHIHKFLRSKDDTPPTAVRRSNVDAKPKTVKAEKPNRTSSTATSSKLMNQTRHVSPPPIAAPASPAGSDIIDVERVSGCEDSPAKQAVAAKPAKPLSVEEILAQLPKIQRDEILWSDSEPDEDVEPPEVIVDDADVERLHCEHVESLNGNATCAADRADPDAEPHGVRMPLPGTYGASSRTCPDDCNFREWHEMHSRVSYSGELLHILPYVVID